ncbi:MAG: AbrB/MazE/SpoVT family DNA-binding domain-containing protein [Deltaproteobacteria bacterium]|nr:AbrB/MazE/SpoVT family DNA-binding domain-containing protein [Deltaproteobacteria bacterium]
MLHELKLRKVGNSVGVVLPKEVLSYLKVEEGDTVCVSEAPDGSLRVSPASAEFTRQMEVAEDVIRRYRNTLRELAK